MGPTESAPGSQESLLKTRSPESGPIGSIGAGRSSLEVERRFQASAVTFADVRHDALAVARALFDGHGGRDRRLLALLRTSYRRRDAVALVARRLGLSSRQVLRRLARAGWSPRRCVALFRLLALVDGSAQAADAAALARRVGVSARTLQRMTIKHFGVAPSVLLRRRPIAEARGLGSRERRP